MTFIVNLHQFPIVPLHKARIPFEMMIFATPSLYDQVARRLRHTTSFCDQIPRRATVKKIGREVAPPRFLFESKSASRHFLTEVAPLYFFFRTQFPFSRYRRGQRSRHVLFSPLKRQEHARIAGIRPTQLRHLSPVLFLILTRVLPVPLSRRDEDLAGYVFKMRMSI